MTYLLMQTFLLLLSAYFFGAFVACVAKRWIMSARGGSLAAEPAGWAQGGYDQLPAPSQFQAPTGGVATAPLLRAEPAERRVERLPPPAVKPRVIEPVQPKIDILPRPAPRPVPKIADVSRFDRALWGPELNEGMPRVPIVEIRPAVFKLVTGPALPWPPPKSAAELAAEAEAEARLVAELEAAAEAEARADAERNAPPAEVIEDILPQTRRDAQQSAAELALSRPTPARSFGMSGALANAAAAAVNAAKAAAAAIAPPKEAEAPKSVAPSPVMTGTDSDSDDEAYDRSDRKIADADTGLGDTLSADDEDDRGDDDEDVGPARRGHDDTSSDDDARDDDEDGDSEDEDSEKDDHDEDDGKVDDDDDDERSSENDDEIGIDDDGKGQAAAAAPLVRGAPIIGGDDLQRIRAIDEDAEQGLKSLGIMRFEDIAHWTPADINRLNQALGLAGRIDREQWIEQAQILAKGGETYYSRNRAAAAKTKQQLSSTAPEAPTGAAPDSKPASPVSVTVTPSEPTLKSSPVVNEPAMPVVKPTVAASNAGIQGRSVAELAAAAAAAIAAASASVTRGIRPIEPISPLSKADPNLVMPTKLADAIKEQGNKGASVIPVPGDPEAAGGHSSRANAGTDARDADDLKRIRGIGVLIEKRLNGLGVTRYDQIANWTSGDIDRMSRTLDFKGRIERENWVEQARILSSGGHTEFSRRVDRGEVESSRDT